MGLKRAHILFHDRSGEPHDAMKFFAKLPLALLVLAFTANAAQPQPQTNDAPLKGGLCFTKAYNGQDSIFTCEHIGPVTIRQIYEKGWRVVHRMANNDIYQFQSLIIEEQRR